MFLKRLMCSELHTMCWLHLKAKKFKVFRKTNKLCIMMQFSMVKKAIANSIHVLLSFWNLKGEALYLIP